MHMDMSGICQKRVDNEWITMGKSIRALSDHFNNQFSWDFRRKLTIDDHLWEDMDSPVVMELYERTRPRHRYRRTTT